MATTDTFGSLVFCAGPRLCRRPYTDSLTSRSRQPKRQVLSISPFHQGETEAQRPLRDRSPQYNSWWAEPASGLSTTPPYRGVQRTGSGRSKPQWGCHQQREGFVFVFFFKNLKEIFKRVPQRKLARANAASCPRGQACKFRATRARWLMSSFPSS